MRRTQQSRQMAAMAAVLIAVGRAMAQDQQQVPERRIVVSIPDRKLALVEDGEVVKIYPIAVGASRSPSPRGTFQIAQRVTNPTWYHPGKVVPPGKDNPLGTRWIGLSTKGYGIHGTNSPRSIGRNASHGCIRMRNRDVEELFARVAIGDVVEMHGERDADVAQIFGMPAPPAQKPVVAEPVPVAIAAAGDGQ